MALAVGKTKVVEPEATGTTSISSLPNANSPNTNKVVLEKREIPTNATQQNNIPPAQLSQDSINQIVLGLQQASKNNMTSLASRDIPMNTENIVRDEAVKPNYIPEAPANRNYIEEDSTFDSLVRKNQKVQKERDSLESLYEELQTPIFVMVLFFLFQLPYFHKVLVRFAPSVFNMDGKIGLGGLMGKTILFGIAYYSLTKITNHLSHI